MDCKASCILNNISMYVYMREINAKKMQKKLCRACTLTQKGNLKRISNSTLQENSYYFTACEDRFEDDGFVLLLPILRSQPLHELIFNRIFTPISISKIVLFNSWSGKRAIWFLTAQVLICPWYEDSWCKLELIIAVNFCWISPHSSHGTLCSKWTNHMIAKVAPLSGI